MGPAELAPTQRCIRCAGQDGCNQTYQQAAMITWRNWRSCAVRQQTGPSSRLSQPARRKKDWDDLAESKKDFAGYFAG
jgi:hypothetical protein